MDLDLTGGLSDNRQTTSIPINYNGGEIAIITPQGGFFHTSMSSPIVKYGGRTLVHGRDYRYIYRSKDVRDKYKISAHASIAIILTGLKGQVEFTASYLGGTYRLYKTDYLKYVTSTDYLLSLYDIKDLLDLPEHLPVKASVLDAEMITGGMVSSVQLFYAIGMYLKDAEEGLPKPSSGYSWPQLTIKDRLPPIEIHTTMVGVGATPIPEDNLPKARMNFYPLGALPLGYNVYQEVEVASDNDFYYRPDMGNGIDGMALDMVIDPPERMGGSE